jgi:hypothetical protein
LAVELIGEDACIREDRKTPIRDHADGQERVGQASLPAQ